MAYQTPEDDRFEEILMMDGVNIQEFHQEDPADIFPTATYFPQFFEQNLVNPNRVLKQFLNDPQSNIRIFYFQLLRLAFEVPTEMGYNHICLQNFKKIVFHPEFEILFTPDTEAQRDIYNDFQFKKLFAQFISLLITASQSQPPSIEQAIDQFPIMDVVLIHIIRSLIVSFNIKVAFDEKIQTDLLFKQLSSVLQLSLTSYGNCWKFEQSDMFCFEQNEEEIYVAFIADEEYADDDQNLQTIQSIQNQQRSQQNDERSSDVNLINSTSDKNNHPRQRSDQYTPQEYTTPQYVTYDQKDDDVRKWSNELYSNQTFGDGKYSEPQPNVITSIPDNRYRGQSLNNQPTVISHNGFNAENSRIEQMFSKIDSTLNNIHGGSRAAEQIQVKSEIGPLSRAYEQQNNQNNSRYQPPSNRYQPPKNRYEPPSNRYEPPSNRQQPYQPNQSQNNYSHHNQNNQANHFMNNTQHTNYTKHHESSHNYSTNTYASTNNYNHQSSVSYEPSNSYVSVYKFQKTDYNQDFTPVEVLSQLRPQNRQNIIQIKQYFKGLRRGGQIPQGFDLSKSIIRAASNFQSRSYAKSQLLSDQRPFSTNITSNNNNMYSTSYSSQSYSSFYN